MVCMGKQDTPMWSPIISPFYCPPFFFFLCYSPLTDHISVLDWNPFSVFAAEGAENDLEFTIVRPFNWIGPRMDFIPGIDGPSESVPRVLACFSNVSFQQLS